MLFLPLLLSRHIFTFSNKLINAHFIFVKQLETFKLTHTHNTYTYTDTIFIWKWIKETVYLFVNTLKIISCFKLLYNFLSSMFIIFKNSFHNISFKICYIFFSYQFITQFLCQYYINVTSSKSKKVENHLFFKSIFHFQFTEQILLFIVFWL